MMSDLIAQGGAGGAGALFGTFLAFIGFKSRLDGQDKRLERLADNVMYEDTCEAKTKGLEKQIESQSELMTEMRDDIKELLRKNL